MKRFLTLSIFVFLIVGFIGNAHAPEVEKFKIYVSVTCKDKNTKSLLESYIKRELRSLQDVIIMKFIENIQGDSATHGLKVTAAEPINAATGNKSGDIIISVVFLEYIYPYEILKRHLPEKKWQEMMAEHVLSPVTGKRTLDTLYSNYILNQIQYDVTKNSQQICKEIVALFDTDVLEKVREKR